MTKRYHINPETGNPGVCRAKVKCRFGDLEKDHHGSPEQAREAYERKAALAEVFVLIEEKTRQLEHFDEIKDAQFTRERTRFGGYSSMFTGSHEEYKKASAGFDRVLLEIDRLKDKTREPIAPHQVDFPAAVNFESAQAALLTEINMEPNYNKDNETYYYRKDVVPHAKEVIARYFAGERVGEDAETYAGFLVPGDRMLADLSGERGSLTLGHNLAYTTLVFPEKDLKPVLERLGVENVTVSHFTNSRENGLVYTVLQPDGNSRSFTAYEHRNTDSIVINGCTNWDPETETAGPRPREASGSRDVLAEFSGNDRRQQAETLGYFLKEAQEGRLESDTELMMKAEKLDWTAILSDQIPGFREWAEENGAEDRKRGFED